MPRNRVPVDGMSQQVDINSAAEMVKSGAAVARPDGRIAITDPYERAIGTTFFSGSAIRGTLTLPFAGRDDALLSFELLRLIARRSSVVKPPIDFVVRTLQGTPYRIKAVEGMRVPQRAIRQAEELFVQPMAEMGQDTFIDVLAKLLRDQLVLDHGIVLKHRGDGGGLEAFEAMDAATFLPQQNEEGRGRLNNWLQRLKNGQEEEFPVEDVVSFVINRRSDSLFGEPPLEAAIHEVNALLTASKSFSSAMNANEIPPGVLLLMGGNSPNAVSRLEKQVRRDRGVRNDYALKTIAGIENAKWVPFQKPLREMQVAELMERLERIIFRLFGVDRIAMGCHSEDTQVLTLDGWKYHSEVDENRDMLATYAPDGGITYVRPVKKFEYEYDGKMVHFHSRDTDALVTPNHRMYASRRHMGDIYGDYEFIEAGSMMKGDFKFKASGYNHTGGPYQEEVEIAGKTYDMNAWLRFLGLLISEGSIYSRDGKGHVIQFGASNPSTVAAIRDSLEELGIKYHEFHIDATENFEGHISKASVQFKIWNKKLCKALASDCGTTSINKRIPYFVWDLPVEQLRILFDALVEGDGSLNQYGRGSGSYTTISEQLADDVQRLSLVLGYRPNINVEERLTVAGNEVYTVRFVKTDEYGVSARRGGVSEVDYQGTVWCYEVEPYHTLITRRQGKVLIAGNSAQDVNRSTAEAMVMTRNFSLFKPLLDIWANKFTFEVLKEIHPGLFIEFIHAARTGMEMDIVDVGPVGSMPEMMQPTGTETGGGDDEEERKLYYKFGRVCGGCEGKKKFIYHYNGEPQAVECPDCGGRGVGGPLFVSRPNSGRMVMPRGMQTIHTYGTNPSRAWEELATPRMKNQLLRKIEDTQGQIQSMTESVGSRDTMLQVGRDIKKALVNLFETAFEEAAGVAQQAGLQVSRDGLNDAKARVYDLIRFQVNKPMMDGADHERAAITVGDDAVYLCNLATRVAGQALADALTESSA